MANAYLIKLGRENLPKGAPLFPITSQDWNGAFRFAPSNKAHRIKIGAKDGKGGPLPESGDRVYIWVHEGEGGSGLAARAIIIDPVLADDGKELTFTLADVEPQQAKVTLREAHAEGSFLHYMNKRRHNRIYALQDEDIDQQEGFAAPVFWDVHSREAPFDYEANEHLKALDKTTREAVVDARIGQGRFRSKLIEYWKGCCAVTGLANERLLRASHIKPWADSDNDERLDPFNGLLLSPSLDLAFDQHLIAFDQQGSIMLSKTFSTGEWTKLGILVTQRLRQIDPRHVPYLKVHQERFTQLESERLP